MRVVVTRPEPSAARTGRQLETLGHEPVFLPLTTAVHFPAVARRALTTRHAGLIVTSAEVFRALDGDLLPAAKPSATALVDTAYAPPHRLPLAAETPLYAVGEATAAAARKAGFTAVFAGPGTGEQLAVFIAGRAAPDGRPLLYLAGRPRSSGLEEGLRTSRIPFFTAEIYEMAAIPHPSDRVRETLEAPPADAVLLYSREAARLFCSLAEPLGIGRCGLRLLCLSTTVAEAVPDALRHTVAIAGTPDEDGMMDLLPGL